jgi:endonuclease/exonuclease/phosphatase family metal-dependent hydrolase
MPEFEGYVVGVELSQSALAASTHQTWRIFCLHVPAPYKKTVNQILDAIANLSEDHPLILGGDFNLTTGIRHISEQSQDHNPWLLERLRKEFNLLSCWQAANPNRDLPQTLRWSGDKTVPYHCDGIFVPAVWYQYLDTCHVLSGPVWDSLSDHNPVVAVLGNG